MKLGFHYHMPALREGGVVRMNGSLGRFVDGLAEFCDRVVCFQHSPLAPELPLLDHEIRGANVEWVDIGPHTSVPRRVLAANKFVVPFAACRGDLDALLVRGPSPLLPAFVRAAGPLPTALLLVGSYVDGVDGLAQPRWRKELIRLWFHYNKWGQDRAVRKSLTLVNSRKLFEKMRSWAPNLVETRTTTLEEGDFCEKADTCTEGNRVRLLYVGRIDAGKGVEDLVACLPALVAAGVDVSLDIVGWPEGRDPTLKNALAQAIQLGLGERVTYRGRAAMGPELFGYYRRSDIYVLPSRSPEGFPRTIWEAMAHSLPVVATRVGSIPDFVGDAVELAEPGDIRSLSAAVLRIVRNPSVRRARIGAGFSLARQNTTRIRAKEMVAAIARWKDSTRLPGGGFPFGVPARNLRHLL